MPADVRHGDCLDVMRAMPADSVHAIVTDPPYGLGFMGKAWDDLPPGVEWAEECLRVLRPGGYLLAFGGTRTFHRLAVAVEDAGFEIRDSIAWLYGSGFPKSLDVSKAIDKAAGATREVTRAGEPVQYGGLGEDWTVGVHSSKRTRHDAPATDAARQWAGWGTALKPSHEPVICARKPAGQDVILAEIGSHLDRLEIECQAQAAELITRTGAAAGSPAATATSWSESERTTCWNIVTSWRNCWADLCALTSTSTTGTMSATTTDLRTLSCCLSRLTLTSTLNPATSPPGLTSLASAVDNLFASVVCGLRATLALSATEPATGDTQHAPQGAVGRSPAFEPIVVARKPLTGTVAANIQAWGTGALNIDACRVASRPGDYAHGGNDNRVSEGWHGGGLYVNAGRQVEPHSAGRWPANVVLDGDQADALDQATGHPHNPGTRTQRDDRSPFASGSAPLEQDEVYGDSGGASRFFKVVSESPADYGSPAHLHDDGLALPSMKYQAKAPTAERPTYVTADGRKIAHPTVKPLGLMRWLVRLVTPPGGTVLDPFAGSGATVEACLLEGFDCIAIERDPDYLPLIAQRIDRQGDALPFDRPA